MILQENIKVYKKWNVLQACKYCSFIGFLYNFNIFFYSAQLHLAPSKQFCNVQILNDFYAFQVLPWKLALFIAVSRSWSLHNLMIHESWLYSHATLKEATRWLIITKDRRIE